MRLSDRLILACLIVFLCPLVSVFGQFRLPSTGRVEYTAPAKKVVARRISGTLSAASGKTVLLMLTDPANSDVFIDGVSKGESDDEGRFRAELPTGKQYKIDVKKDRYISYSQQVKIDSSDPTLIQANLQATFGSVKIIGDTSEDSKSLTTAKILLDDKPAAVSIDQANRQASISDVPVGEHKITIVHPNFVVWEKELEVVGGYEMTLAPKLIAAAKLDVRAPAGTDVLIDKIKQGTTSSNGDLQIVTPLQPGEHQVSLEKAGYVTQFRTINLAASDKNSLKVEELEPNPSYVELVDYFNDGLTFWNAPSSWKWDSQKKAVTIQESGSASRPDIGLAKDRSFRDFEFVFDVTFTNGVGASWIIRGRNADNYYLFVLSVKEQRLFSYLVDHGQRKALNVSNVILPVDKVTSFRVQAYVQSNRIRHYIINNSTADLELMGVDVDDTFRYGSVGFTATNGQVFTVKDAFVRPYKDPAVSTGQ